MLITTGKGPDAASRRIAGILSLSIPFARQENRGSRALSALISKARRFRFTRLCTVYKEGGKPATLAFLSIDEGGFEWLSPKIQIEKVVFLSSQTKRIPQATQLSIKGTKKLALQKLIPPLNTEGGQSSTITAGAKTISIHIGRKKMLTLGVTYGR